MMGDDPFLKATKTQANDALARLLEWGGLIAGISLCAWALSIPV
ncbi:hypothetical protein [Microvirga tunisiensis]|nr:hypothetical protein [Microvirga tunisiensis]